MAKVRALSQDLADRGVDLARAIVVTCCALALIAAGQAIPF